MTSSSMAHLQITKSLTKATVDPYMYNNKHASSTKALTNDNRAPKQTSYKKSKAFELQNKMQAQFW